MSVPTAMKANASKMTAKDRFNNQTTIQNRS
jgi:hypothetical protein